MTITIGILDFLCIHHGETIPWYTIIFGWNDSSSPMEQKLVCMSGGPI